MHHFFQKIAEIKKSFGIHICISLVCSGTKQKKAEKKSLNLRLFHTEILKWPGQYFWHLPEVVRNNYISSR